MRVRVFVVVCVCLCLCLVIVSDCCELDGDALYRIVLTSLCPSLSLSLSVRT